ELLDVGGTDALLHPVRDTVGLPFGEASDHLRPAVLPELRNSAGNELGDLCGVQSSHAVAADEGADPRGVLLRDLQPDRASVRVAPKRRTLKVKGTQGGDHVP